MGYGSGTLLEITPRRSGPAKDGAVTHPGAKGEKQCYADL